MAVITSAVIVAAAAVYSGVQARKQAKAAARSQRLQQRQADLESARQRRALLRTSRVQRASIEAQAAGSGLVGSSAAAAAQSNVTSRTNENLSFLDQSIYLSQKASAANEQAAKYASNAATGQAIGAAAGAAGNIYGG